MAGEEELVVVDVVECVGVRVRERRCGFWRRRRKEELSLPLFFFLHCGRGPPRQSHHHHHQQQQHYLAHILITITIISFR